MVWSPGRRQHRRVVVITEIEWLPAVEVAWLDGAEEGERRAVRVHFNVDNRISAEGITVLDGWPFWYITPRLNCANACPWSAALVDYRRYIPLGGAFSLAGRAMHFGRYGADAEDSRMGELFIGYPHLLRGYNADAFAADCAPGDSSLPGATVGFRQPAGAGQSRAALLGGRLPWPRAQSGPSHGGGAVCRCRPAVVVAQTGGVLGSLAQTADQCRRRISRQHLRLCCRSTLIQLRVRAAGGRVALQFSLTPGF